MRVTVASCTWNRNRLLDQSLSEMRKLRIPSNLNWEFMVANNNNCTDDSDAVITRHQKVLPIQGLHESRQGHSNARNCAIDAARSDLLTWTDDDVLVDSEWLAAYVGAAERWPDTD
jgi:glucosyl-dolichyl phosphate glucuronosyltransferase